MQLWVTGYFFAIVILFQLCVRKSFAFRTHDVIFQSGVIATNTVILITEYNMWFARRIYFQNFGLAKLKYIQQEEVLAHCYSGITLAHAENIKQLVMGKIQKEL
jgi:hypothetical protein